MRLKKSFYRAPGPDWIINTMSTVAKIEAAIKALPPTERERLAGNLPSILPELNGDAKWQRIVNAPRPRPALTALGNEIVALKRPHSKTLRAIRESPSND